jgi:hypothetical protein
MKDLLNRIRRRLDREIALQTNRLRVNKLTRAIDASVSQSEQRPILVFNASTRLSGLSQNAGFSLLTSLALRADGVPVIHFVCNHGLTPCVLGTDRDNPSAKPPCRECVRTSRFVYAGADVHWFSHHVNQEIEQQLEGLDLQGLMRYEYEHIPLGKLILPSMRWILRRHHLQNDAETCALARAYIQSAWNVYAEFSLLLASRSPQAVVVFNGMFYPEAMARFAAHEKGLPVYSHEVGMLPFSAFFTDQEATAYPVAVDNDFQLDLGQNERLDQYLADRFQGNFQTAGVKFWPEMKQLDGAISEKAARHQALVPIFTNVIFDTSQAHANTLFEHMFSWLDIVVERTNQHPETLFIIRAHPDEVRPGKESRESVADWYHRNKLSDIENLIFIPPDEFISSYDLIQRAKFVMVYNSTVGLEASIMGKPVLCAGKARYTQIPTVFFPDTREEYEKKLEEFLSCENIDQPQEFIRNARRVLYSQLFRASIPFDQYLKEDGVWRGYIQFKDFNINELTPERSEVFKVVLNGILKGDPFIRDL